MQEKQGSLFRVERLKERLFESGIDGCLIERPVDLLYFTGLKLSAGKLLVSASQTLLLVDGRYIQAAEEKAPFHALLDSPKQWMAFCQRHGIRTLGFDGRHTSYDRYQFLEKGIKQAKNSVELVDCSRLLNLVRVVKDAQEIAKMQRSAELLWEGFHFIVSHLKTGVKERELAKLFEIFCLERGADGLSFEPIIAFGANSAMPHYRSQETSLKEQDVVLIDIGVVLDAYHSDMTRVVFHNTEESRLKTLYETVKRAQKSALALCQSGSTFKQLDEAVRAVFKEENVEELFVHSLGHGIGLETHEFPRIKFDSEESALVMEPGMVFTVEPGLYVPGLGGVRYEDTVVITQTGYVNFYPQGA